MTIRTPYTPLGRPRAYERGEVLLDVSSGSGSVYLRAGFYDFSCIGAGGGGGGGAYKHSPAAGQGGGSGAGFVGVVFFREGNYSYSCGAGGNGGGISEKTGFPGGNGVTTTWTFEGTRLITAGGGYGGQGNGKWPTPNGNVSGNPGKLSVSDKLNIHSFSVKRDGYPGTGNRNAGYGGAAVDGVHGAGGAGNYIRSGGKGGNGFIKVSYLGEEPVAG